MTKYFVVEAAVESVLRFEVAAESEDEARAKAQREASDRAGSARVTRLALTPHGETEFAVGMRVRHELFGPGTILGIRSTTNGANERGFALQIRFDTGDEKSISSSIPKSKLTIMDA